jgi:type IV pilus assembly protein PilM
MKPESRGAEGARLRTLVPTWLRRRYRPLVGIDISSVAVKVLELGWDGSRYRVDAFAVEALPPNAVIERRVHNPDAVGETIQRAVRRARTKTKAAVAAVPASAVITKLISVPDVPNEAEMETQIELEVGRHVPFPLEEINFDYQIMGPCESELERSDVLVVASRNENVDMRAAAIELAGLKPRIIDVEPYALEHACALLESQLTDGGYGRTIAIIDIGATNTILTVLQDRQTTYTREQPFGGKQLTEDIMRHFGLSLEDAGRGKRLGGLPKSYEPEVLEPFKHNMAQQVGRALQWFFASGDQVRVDQIVLAGGCASIPGIADLIAEEQRIPVIVANPFAEMTLAPKVNAQHLTNDAPALLLACGLALRSFD